MSKVHECDCRAAGEVCLGVSTFPEDISGWRCGTVMPPHSSGESFAHTALPSERSKSGAAYCTHSCGAASSG